MTYIDDWSGRLSDLSAGAPIGGQTGGAALADAMYGYAGVKLAESAAKSEQQITALKFKIAIARAGQWLLQPMVLLIVAGIAVFLVLKK